MTGFALDEPRLLADLTDDEFLWRDNLCEKIRQTG